MRMRHVVICGLSGCTIFFFKISDKRHDFRKTKFINIEYILIISTTFIWNISKFWEQFSEILLQMHIGIYVKRRYSDQNLMKLLIFSTEFQKKFKH
jgi:hypothetical protein